jgi:hypothetical protein
MAGAVVNGDTRIRIGGVYRLLAAELRRDADAIEQGDIHGHLTSAVELLRARAAHWERQARR